MAGLKGGGGVGSPGSFFLALKKISGQRMAVCSGGRFHGKWMLFVGLRRYGNPYD
jgi:hypothetical protein